jgi:electron transport complex protein RnfD
MNIRITEQAQKQNLGIEAAPHLHGRMSTRMIMGATFLALLPAAGAFYYFTGFGFVWQFLISLATAIVCEGGVVLLRHRPLLASLTDCSYPITCLILALTLPPLLPWYLTCAATAFAILLVKEAFGGLGMNIFNPAMAGFIFLFVSCSGFMFRTWVAPVSGAYEVMTPSATMDVIFYGEQPMELKSRLHYPAPGGAPTASREGHDADNPYLEPEDTTSGASADSTDATSGATILESVKASRKGGRDDLAGVIAMTGTDPYFWISGMFALGGLALMFMRIIIVKMAVAFFLAVALFSGIGHMLWPALYMPPLYQLVLGGTAICGFFIITDPVTNAGTSKGRIAFAVLCAFLIVAIRALGSYSDSVAFSVLLSNAAAPLIDVLTHRRPFGHGHKNGELE